MNFEHSAAAGPAPAPPPELPVAVDQAPALAEPARPAGGPPPRPGWLTIRLESQHRPMTAVVPWPAPAVDDTEPDAHEEWMVDTECSSSDLALQQPVPGDDGVGGAPPVPAKESSPSTEAPPAADLAPPATPLSDAHELAGLPPDADPGEPAPQGGRPLFTVTDGGAASEHRQHRERRAGRRARPRTSDAADVDAVNREIEALPQIRSAREIILLVHRYLDDAFARRPPRLVLAGGLRQAVQASRAVVHTALLSLSCEPGTRALLLPASPHHGCQDPALVPLACHAAARGFTVDGHDPLGQADAHEPLYRADLREGAMQHSLAAALRDAQAVLAMMDAAEVVPLHHALTGSHELACIGLVGTVGLDECQRAARMQALLHLPGALVLRPSPLLEAAPWCTPGFVEQVCAAASGGASRAA